MPAGRYLLGAGHRVRVPLHQLLERDGLRVRSAGDLQTREQSARLRIPPSPSCPPSLGSYRGAGAGAVGERAGAPPPRALPPLFTTRAETASSPRARAGWRWGRRTCTRWVPRAVTNPRRKRARPALRTHTWATQTLGLRNPRGSPCPAPPRRLLEGSPPFLPDFRTGVCLLKLPQGSHSPSVVMEVVIFV